MRHDLRRGEHDRRSETRAIAEAIGELSTALDRLEALLARLAATSGRRRPLRRLDRAA